MVTSDSEYFTTLTQSVTIAEAGEYILSIDCKILGQVNGSILQMYVNGSWDGNFQITRSETWEQTTSFPLLLKAGDEAQLRILFRGDPGTEITIDKVFFDFPAE